MVPVSVHWKMLKNATEKERLMVLTAMPPWVLGMAYAWVLRTPVLITVPPWVFGMACVRELRTQPKLAPASVYWKAPKNAIQKGWSMVLKTKSSWVLEMAYARELQSLSK